MNPFFTRFNTPFETPPFNLIKNKHFTPAFLRGMEEQKKEVDAIDSITELPTFENTIEALERSGLSLDKISSVFYGLQAANTNDEI